jgi:hypothetical protein
LATKKYERNENKYNKVYSGHGIEMINDRAGRKKVTTAKIAIRFFLSIFLNRYTFF